VSFTVDAPSVADVGSSSDWDLLTGVSAGSATVRLGTHTASTVRAPSLVIAVSDVPVRAASMVTRLVTHVTWSLTPTYWYSFGTSVSAEVLVSQRLDAEGVSGLLYSAVTWSDGAVEPVGNRAWSQLDEITEPSSNANVFANAPLSSSNSETFWELGVAVGATRECLTDVFVNWTVCGVAIATSAVPMFLELPDPTGVQLTAVESRLTSSTDDASLSPISVPTSTALRALVSFSDGTSRDMTADTRMVYDTADSSCATMDGSNVAATKVARFVNCTSVVVIATVSLGAFTLTANTSVPLVYLDRLVLEFVGYPDYNSAIQLTRLYRIECLDTVYQPAAPRLHAYLTDGTSSVDVTASASYVSNDTQIIYASTTLLGGISAGSALVTATFGTVPTTASAILTVEASVAPVSAVDWTGR
jgi:hypothetical protein